MKASTNLASMPATVPIAAPITACRLAPARLAPSIAEMQSQQDRVQAATSFQVSNRPRRQAADQALNTSTPRTLCPCLSIGGE